MKINKKIDSVALASAALTLFLILASSMASASPGQTPQMNTTPTSIPNGAGDPSEDQIVFDGNITLKSAAATTSTVESAAPKITKTQITTNKSDQYCPVIYSNRIVWTDDRNGNWDIYIYDLSTKKQIRTISTSIQWDPAIYGDRVVWVDDRNENWDIYMCNLSTKKQTRITTDGAWHISPAIYGDKIVWQDDRNGNFDIYMYDLSTSKEKRITTDGSSHEYPAIYGDRIVWMDHSNGDIYMYDLSTSKETRITTSGSAYCPDIYGNRIVWSDDRNGNADIYMYDLSTKKETQITNNSSASYDPVIHGDRIAWWDDHNGNQRDIYVYDLVTRQESHTTDGSGQYYPGIYNDKIVWSDDRNGNADIYMGTLSESKPTTIPPVANFSAIPTSGKTPLKVKFTSTSTGAPTAWKWSFGDGSALVTEQNPEHIYSTAGVYTVKHTVSNAGGKDTEIKTKYVTVTSPQKSPVASFSASPTSGKAPLKVTFTDKSTGTPTSRKWSFGDGTSSTIKNPVHKYNKAGKYIVSLTVKNAAGSNTKTMFNYITVKK